MKIIIFLLDLSKIQTIQNLNNIDFIFIINVKS